MGGKWHEEVKNGSWVRALWPYFLCGCRAIRRKIEQCKVCEGEQYQQIPKYQGPKEEPEHCGRLRWKWG